MPAKQDLNGQLSGRQVQMSDSLTKVELILRNMNRISDLEQRNKALTTFVEDVFHQIEHFGMFDGPEKMRAIKRMCLKVKTDLDI